MSNERNEDNMKESNWARLAIEVGGKSAEFDEARKIMALGAMLEDKGLRGEMAAAEMDLAMFEQVMAYQVGLSKIAAKEAREAIAVRKKIAEETAVSQNHVQTEEEAKKSGRIHPMVALGGVAGALLGGPWGAAAGMVLTYWIFDKEK